MDAPRATPTILVVEDEFASLEVMAMMFEAYGYHALMASNGDAALQLLLGERVDLMVTDYMMPQMTGLMLCEELHRHEHLRHIPVILMSGNRPEDIGPAPQIAAFFGKPVIFDDLLQTVRRLVGNAEL